MKPVVQAEAVTSEIDTHVDATRVTTYSLLAHINENSGSGIQDLSDIFIPLVKSALAKMNKDFVTKGESLVEIKDFVDKEYRLDIPIPFLNKLLKKVSDEINSDGKEHIKIYNDGAFVIKNFVFSDIEETVSRQETEVEVLNQAFSNFLLVRGEESDKCISIFDFLDSNRASLSCYFAYNGEKNPEITSSVHADFIESIKNEHALFSTLKKIYLGSIISGYLEISVGKIKSDVEFVLDTNFIISLLDLTSPESHHTCHKIIQICKRLGYRITVLDDTINETTNLLKIVASKIEDAILVRKIDKETIESACDRRKLTKTDLQRFAANLIQEISDLGIIIIAHTKPYRNEAKFSPIYETFKKIRNNPQAALHDATAVTYVRKKRERFVTDFYEAKCWFVTHTQRSLEYTSHKGNVPEIIKAEDLINILWLTSPNVSNTEMLEVGLTRLISSAYSNNLPSNRLLRHLDEKISRYAKGKVDPRDIVLLANSVADQTVKNLDLLEKATGDDFITEIQLEARREEAKQRRRDELTQALISDKSHEAEKRIEQIKSDLFQRNQNDLEEATTRLTSEHTRELLNQKLSTDQERIKDLNREKQLLITFRDRYEKESHEFATKIVGATTILLPLIFIGLIYKFGWDIMEPITYIFGLVLIPISYLIFAIKNKDFSYNALHEYITERRRKKLYFLYRFDENRVSALEKLLNRAEAEVKETKRLLDIEDEAITLL
ncbi:hypothetical protein [Hymenobacter koreensis]|uniref:Calcium uniporter protein C-terminal domain-containing protein n=1 Tax=Hymenobacter koreensis TaxID=1084523 RepID=A0ABP8JH90_9BACT